MNRIFQSILALFVSQLISNQLLAQSQLCSPCTKPIIAAQQPPCTVTPTATHTPTPTATATPTFTPTICPTPQISLSLNSLTASTSINIDGNLNASYSATGSAVVSSSPGTQLSISGGNEARLQGNTIQFSASGAAIKSINANDKSAGGSKCTGKEPFCAKPCNFGGCVDCNCSLYGSNGGHVYGWTNVYRYSVDFSKQYTVTAANVCGTASAPLTVNVKGNKQQNVYFEQWAYSPISLNLTGSQFNLSDRRFTKVDFKLSPSIKNKIYWLASADTPLLVWDPEKTGQIKDGTQLFGTWTFGKDWESGYHALASLDKNKDSFLKNEELNGIRLWLDKDRNGQSTSEEVVDLNSIGLTSISVKFNRQETLPIHGILAYISDKGFEYTVNGSAVWAETFDWMVPQVEDQISFETELKKAQEQGYTVKEWSEENLEMMGNRSFGYILVKRSTDNKLSGFSIRATKSNKEPFEYALSSTPISGIWTDTRFEFTYKDLKPSGPMTEIINAFANIKDGTITPERLEIIHSQGPQSEMKREAKWKLLEPTKPF